MRSKEKSAFASDDSLTADEILSETLSETSDSSLSSKDVVVEDEIDKENKRKKRKIILFSSLGAALTVGIVTGTVFLGSSLHHFGHVKPGASSSATVEVTSAGQVAVPTDDPNASQNFARENPIPFEHEKWQAAPYTAQVTGKDKSSQVPNDDLRSSILSSVAKGSLDGGGLASAASTLPSEAAGFTSDLDKQTMEDGTPNPMFSYWTEEQFSAEVGIMTERLLNPVFGGWENYQYPEYKANTEFDTALISDLFTSNWSESNSAKPHSEYVPVLADWNSDNYGGKYNLTDVARWFGKVTSSSTTFTYDESKLNYTATYEAKVKFTAWTKDQKKVERTGTLTLNLVPAVTQEYGNNTSNRVLIDSGSLRMDD